MVSLTTYGLIFIGQILASPLDPKGTMLQNFTFRTKIGHREKVLKTHFQVSLDHELTDDDDDDADDVDADKSTLLSPNFVNIDSREYFLPEGIMCVFA